MSENAPSLKGVQKLIKGGRVYYYDRATRKKLPGEPGSPEFEAALEAARVKPAKEGTLAALIARFQTSQEWRALRASTQDNYKTNFKAIIDEFGNMPVKFVGLKEFRRDVMRWRDKYAEKYPRAADAKVTVLSTVLSWAEERGEAPGNALKSLSRTYHADRSELIWEKADIEAFNAVASEALQKAVLLAAETGQRSGDLRAMRWRDYDGKGIRIKQSKTGRRVYIPVTDALKAMLKAETVKGPFILTNSLGNPWQADSFKRSFRAARKRAKLTHLNFHDLRGTTVTRLAEAGCTVPEIAAITGHSIERCQKIIDAYMKRTDNLAEAAIAKLESHRRVAVQVAEIAKIASDENATEGCKPFTKPKTEKSAP